MTHPNPEPDLDQATVLSVLAAVPAATVKTFAETLLSELGRVSVLENRTGLVMLPYRDSAHGALFHLGEVLLAEAHVRLEDHSSEGYAACLGHDLEQALAIALLDAAWQGGTMQARIAPFVQVQAAQQSEAEATLCAQVETTRVEMETF